MRTIFNLKFQAIAMALSFSLVGAWTTSVAGQTDVRPPEAKDGELAWKFQAGDGWKATSEQKMNMTMTMNGNENATKSSTTTEMKFAVKSVSDEGVASLDNVMARMKMETEGPTGKSSFDTSAESNESVGDLAQVAEGFKAVVGKSTTMKMAPDGKMFDVEIPDELAKAFQSDPMLAQLMSKEALEKMSSQGSMKFPKKTMKVGETWKSEELMQMGPMNVKTVMDYTYAGVAMVDGKPLHKITAQIEMSFPDGGPGGSEISVAEQNSPAEFYFDGVKGRMVKATIDQNVKLEISAGPMTIEQNLQQKMATTYSDLPTGSEK